MECVIEDIDFEQPGEDVKYITKAQSMPDLNFYLVVTLKVVSTSNCFKVIWINRDSYHFLQLKSNDSTLTGGGGRKDPSSCSCKKALKVDDRS